MHQSTNNAARRHLSAFAVGSVLLLGSTALFNWLVDPFGAYRGPFTAALAEHKDLVDSRTGKAELARHFAGSTAIIGSSRARMAYDPESPVIPDGPGCNLALGGTNFFELHCVLRHTMQNPRIRRILLILDFQQFADGRTTNSDFDVSRFNPDLSPFKYHCNLLLGRRSTSNSFETLGRTLIDAPAEYTPLGFERPETSRHYLRVNNLVDKCLYRAMTNRQTLWGFRYSRERLYMLRSVVRDCDARGIELVLVIHPLHALQMEAIRCVGLWDAFEQWKHDVVAIVEDETAGRTALWDFTGYSRYNCEQLPGFVPGAPLEGRWYWEPSHCRSTLGQEVLRRLFGHPEVDPSFGVRLTSANLPQHLVRIRRERMDWMAGHPAELDRVDAIAARAGYSPAPIAIAGSRIGAAR